MSNLIEFQRALDGFRKEVAALCPFLYSCEMRAPEFTRNGASLSLLTEITRAEHCFNRLLTDVKNWKERAESAFSAEKKNLSAVRSDHDKGFWLNRSVGLIEQDLQLLKIHEEGFSALSSWLTEKSGKLADWKGTAVHPEELNALSGVPSEKLRMSDPAVQKVFDAFKVEQEKIVLQLSDLGRNYLIYELFGKSPSFRKNYESQEGYRPLEGEAVRIWSNWSFSLKAKKEAMQNASLILSDVEKFLEKVQSTLVQNVSSGFVFSTGSASKSMNEFLEKIFSKKIREIEEIQEAAFSLKGRWDYQEGDMRIQKLGSSLEAIKQDLALMRESLEDAANGYDRPMKWANDKAGKLSSYLPLSSVRTIPLLPPVSMNSDLVPGSDEEGESFWSRLRISDRIQEKWQASVGFLRMRLKTAENGSSNGAQVDDAKKSQNLGIGTDSFKAAIAKRAAQRGQKKEAESNQSGNWKIYVLAGLVSGCVFEIVKASLSRYSSHF